MCKIFFGVKGIWYIYNIDIVGVCFVNIGFGCDWDIYIVCVGVVGVKVVDC